MNFSFQLFSFSASGFAFGSFLWFLSTYRYFLFTDTLFWFPLVFAHDFFSLWHTYELIFLVSLMFGLPRGLVLFFFIFFLTAKGPYLFLYMLNRFSFRSRHFELYNMMAVEIKLFPVPAAGCCWFWWAAVIHLFNDFSLSDKIYSPFLHQALSWL